MGREALAHRSPLVSTPLPSAPTTALEQPRTVEGPLLRTRRRLHRKRTMARAVWIWRTILRSRRQSRPIPTRLPQ